MRVGTVADSLEPESPAGTSLQSVHRWRYRAPGVQLCSGQAPWPAGQSCQATATWRACRVPSGTSSRYPSRRHAPATSMIAFGSGDASEPAHQKPEHAFGVQINEKGGPVVIDSLASLASLAWTGSLVLLSGCTDCLVCSTAAAWRSITPRRSPSSTSSSR